MKILYLFALLLLFYSCNDTQEKNTTRVQSDDQTLHLNETSLVILGTVQDGGSPHIGCIKNCCRELFTNPDINRKVVSIGVIDPQQNNKYLFEATPDMTEQMKMLRSYSAETETPDGIFLTHAHIGHYTGLMFLGKEAMNAKSITVYAMPFMKSFLEKNGPWSQLVTNNNISIREINNGELTNLSPQLKVIPFKVPHRDEYSETVGFVIIGPNKKALFIPDIDKWGKWDKNIIEEISKVDYAFIDGTFYDGEEINHRDISEIPHPFIVESMSLFDDLEHLEKRKIYFIHFNHTNPVLNPNSIQAKEVLKQGFNIARMFDVFPL